MRTVANIIKSERIQLGRTTVKQALPTVRVEQVSPFLLLHHFGPFQVEPGEEAFDVAPHPHRGFEPVTFLYSGGLRHKDSRNNEGILKSGDVQWMTAGRGIIHSERASPEFLENGGTIEGIQLWINLPQAKKMVEPGYQDIKVEQIPQWTEDESRVKIRLVAGDYNGLKGPAQTFTPILALQIELNREGKTFVEIPESFNAMAYILRGEVTLNENFSYKSETLLHFRNDGGGFSLKSNEPSHILVLAGEPINEPLAQWGPYVMNTQTEILEAMRDYQMGKMGFYID
ncbi:pirin family protein [Haliscomenobacter hydrossis]|uniref:Pirin domain protein n=1 Tax=Haliscomenobacter hydrossis (strain ATCC 27775 / DSM 1100 / LMG 10767 / O) TaxID=760192 RepID=F4KWL1_HALH1|nr:pirin family protein [Haliscomenobacter hydrossis]AEE51351.1 Pirin domain protein [Haliscomenobacter hydrossis DSM 1100]